MRFQKKAFTLVELSIVVAVISVISILFASIDFSAKNYAEKRDRIAGKVSDIIRSVRTVSTAGKTFSGTTNICSDFVISFATGSIKTEFAQVSDTGAVINVCGADVEHSTTSPLLGENGYAIKYMTGADINGNTTFCMGDCGTLTPVASSVKLTVKNGGVLIHSYDSGGSEIATDASIGFGLRATFMEGPGSANENPLHGKMVSFDIRSGRICIGDACGAQ